MAFDRETVNRFYNLPSVENERYQKLLEKRNYVEIIKCLENGQAEWNTNFEGHVLGLFYVV